MKKVAYCAGVFDFLHSGHKNLFKRASSIFDVLVIGVTTDEFTQSYKDKPTENELTRLENVKKLSITQNVELVSNDHEWIYKKYKVTHIVHGDDWDRNKYIDHMGREYFEKYNLELVFIPQTYGINSTLIRSHRAYLDDIKLCVLDMDGTIYVSNKMTNQAAYFLDFLTNKDINFYFYSNNTSRTKFSFLKKLHDCGLKNITADNIMTPLDEIIGYLHQVNAKSIYLIGTREVADYLTKSNILITDHHPDYVVLTYDIELNYEKIKTASKWLNAKIPLLVTHPDKFCPDTIGPIPDAGAMLSMFEVALNIKARKVFGKPNAFVINMLKERHGISPQNIMVVGDRLYTDIAMGNLSGCLSTLVLTGDAKIEDVAYSCYKPDYIVNDLSILVEQLHYENDIHYKP